MRRCPATTIFFIRPLALGILSKPGDSGVAFFAVGVLIYLMGLLTFEASRLFGFEAKLKDEQTQPESAIADHAKPQDETTREAA